MRKLDEGSENEPSTWTLSEPVLFAELFRSTGVQNPALEATPFDNFAGKVARRIGNCACPAQYT